MKCALVTKCGNPYGFRYEFSLECSGIRKDFDVADLCEILEN